MLDELIVLDRLLGLQILRGTLSWWLPRYALFCVS